MSTIRDVAKLADVSISTVSRVMNSPESVVPEKRERVRQAIDDLGYRPNALARGLIYKETRTAGAVIPDISNLYAAEVVKGMEDMGHALGMNLILCNTDGSESRIIRNLTVLREKQVDGIFFMSKPVTETYYEMFRTMKIPVVLVATESLVYELPSVKVHDEQASYDALTYLAGKGHTQIAMISGPIGDTVAGLPRYKGFRRASKDTLGLVKVGDRVEFVPFKYQAAYEAMSRLIDRKPDLTAVFCASDEMALGAISLLCDIGLRVPDDVSVIGFDNLKIARMSIPKLTTVEQPMYEIGRQAMLILQKLRNSEPLEQLRLYLPHRIIERDSVRAI
ncbi:MAG TPA: LacI family transcriptional regulator [Firmicutes bacterium]|nr:LacI family transcriptional regulator [Bacillota bacterium]